MYYRHVPLHFAYGYGQPAAWSPLVAQPRYGQPVLVPRPLVVPQPVVGVYVPRDRFLIELNRYLAGRLGMDPHYTISTNIAHAISRATGLEFVTAKRMFHAGVAGFLAIVLSAFGLGIAATLGAGAIVWGWLESYDSSAHRR